MPEPRAGNGLRVFSITLLLCGLLLTLAVLADPPPHLPTLYGFYPQPFGELGDGLRVLVAARRRRYVFSSAGSQSPCRSCADADGTGHRPCRGWLLLTASVRCSPIGSAESPVQSPAAG
jgi:hypothetical protein